MTIQKHSIQLAKAEQLESMFEHMERTLLNIGFLEVKNPKRIMRVLRRILGRSKMEEREVQILQGIWSKMDWHLRKGEKRKG
jgi:tRNA/rRNA methyltransferase